VSGPGAATVQRRRQCTLDRQGKVGWWLVLQRPCQGTWVHGGFFFGSCPVVVMAMVPPCPRVRACVIQKEGFLLDLSSVSAAASSLSHLSFFPSHPQLPRSLPARHGSPKSFILASSTGRGGDRLPGLLLCPILCHLQPPSSDPSAIFGTVLQLLVDAGCSSRGPIQDCSRGSPEVGPCGAHPTQPCQHRRR